MFKHHEETISNITKKLRKKDDILAVIVCGSIAHGFETELSDVDIMIVISDENYKKRKESGDIHYYEKESCTYESGYIDGKYISIDFINQVIEKGSEPARFAFEGAFITYSQVYNLDKKLKQIIKYPIEKKKENICRFYAQYEAWKWYSEEAIKHKNVYLLNHSISKFILFAGRLILSYNEVLYPYHKWFIKVLDRVEKKPIKMIDKINLLLKEPTHDNISSLYQAVNEFYDWEKMNQDWPSVFMQDSELNWLDGKVSIDDI